mmetsp:Transcript_81872/g.144524  ORF Transcript_81872/g.144524 Transcript_81872/m.144524 type:complete len:277 (+) Transcript_81872:1183-2013(+)
MVHCLHPGKAPVIFFFDCDVSLGALDQRMELLLGSEGGHVALVEDSTVSGWISSDFLRSFRNLALDLHDGRWVERAQSISAIKLFGPELPLLCISLAPVDLLNFLLHPFQAEISLCHFLLRRFSRMPDACCCCCRVSSLLQYLGCTACMPTLSIKNCSYLIQAQRWKALHQICQSQGIRPRTRRRLKRTCGATFNVSRWLRIFLRPNVLLPSLLSIRHPPFLLPDVWQFRPIGEKTPRIIRSTFGLPKRHSARLDQVGKAIPSIWNGAMQFCLGGA